jgi:AcrR family transcriptional regulator
VSGSVESRERPQRADARRNRDRLLATAAELFDERGIDAPLEEIARRAEVGIGTLYRHFPTRDALIEAVYRREVEVLCDPVPELLASNPADAALASWMRAFARYVPRKRGMATALKSMIGADSELFAESHDRIRTAIATLVGAAVAQGAIRDDVDAADLLRAMGGICMAADTGSAEGTARLVDLLMDGLRYGAPAGASAR